MTSTTRFVTCSLLYLELWMQDATDGAQCCFMKIIKKHHTIIVYMIAISILAWIQQTWIDRTVCGESMDNKIVRHKENMQHLKMSSVGFRPFCPGVNVLSLPIQLEENHVNLPVHQYRHYTRESVQRIWTWNQMHIWKSWCQKQPYRLGTSNHISQFTMDVSTYSPFKRLLSESKSSHIVWVLW